MTETMAGFESGYADVSDGGRLYWEHAGRGPVIVLIHAGLWDRRIWDAQMEPFAESHRVVRYDLRGFGRSSPLEQPFSAREDLAELLGALGIDQAALVGCSIGGGLAVDFAIEFPGSVSALVAGCAGASGDPTDDDEATFGARNRAPQDNQIALGVDRQNAQVLDRYTGVAQMSGHAHALERAAGGGA